MNRKIIQKIIDELKKESPKIDYVLGILETVIETLPEEKSILIKKNFPMFTGENLKEMSEVDLIDAKAKAAIEEIKRLEKVSI